MANTTYYNNKSTDEKKKSNNTYGPSYYNYDTMEKLSVLYWDSSIAFIISKFSVSGNGSVVEDPNNSVRITVKPYTLTTLASMAEECYDAFKHGNKDEFESSGVPCGGQGNNMLEISNGANIGREPGVYLVIYKDIDSERKTANKAVYTFSSRTVVKGYNSTTGEGKVMHIKSQEFKDFIKVLNDFNSGMNLALAHSFKEATKYDKLSTNKVLALICGSMGIDLMSTKGGNGSYKNRNTPFISGNSSVIDINDSEYKESECDIDITVDDVE